MPLSVRSSTDEGTDPKCARRDAPSDSQSSPHSFRARSQGRPAIPSAGGAELPAGMPLRDTAGRPKAVFLLLACCTQEKMCPRHYYVVDGEIGHEGEFVVDDEAWIKWFSS